MKPNSSASSSRPRRPVSETMPDADLPCIRPLIVSIFSAVVPSSRSTGSITATAWSVSPLSFISASTASRPILSSLSIATVMSVTLSGKPAISARPVRTFLLLIFMATLMPNLVKTRSTICTSSSSLSWDLLPMTSASHW